MACAVVEPLTLRLTKHIKGAAMAEKIKVGVYGASGYAGQDAVEILAKHPNVELVFGTSNTYAGQPIPFTNLTYTPHDQVDLNSVDAVILGLPHKASAPMAAKA